MSRLVRLDGHAQSNTLATAITAFLAEHQLSQSSRRVYAGALRVLEDYVGGDVALAVLDQAQTVEQLADWFMSVTAGQRQPQESGSWPFCAPHLLSGGNAAGSRMTRLLTSCDQRLHSIAPGH